MWNTRTYKSWQAMKSRCTLPSCAGYEYYGGRGISVCKEWLESFDKFLTDMGERPEGCTLDRVDVNGNYEPSNCRWATARKQSNNRRNNKRIQYKGEELTISQWARRLGMSVSTFDSRIKRWSIDKAIETPVDAEKSRISKMRKDRSA